MLLKILGYEGVYPSPECDNTTYGGVIFDMENFTYERLADHVKDYVNKNNLKESTKEDCYMAYHLSPNLFGDFDMEHIGSGFGTGLMGYGLYFTLDSEIVSYYRSQLEDIDGIDFQWYLYKVCIEGNIVDEYDPEGWELYAKLVEEKGEKAASEVMVNEYGIDGVKYYDEEDGRSILVFNPKVVQIIHCKPITAYGKLELWEKKINEHQKVIIDFEDDNEAFRFRKEMKDRFRYPRTTSKWQVVSGKDRNGKKVYR